MMMNGIKKLIDKLPYVRNLARYRDAQFVPPGHYYSPIVSGQELLPYQSRVFNTAVRVLPGIDLREQAQLELVRSFVPFYREIPQEWHSSGRRYTFHNGFYRYSDAIMLMSMMRRFAPKRIIEIGSGFSSAVMLDTNEIFLQNNTALTFIEPYPDRLKSLLRSQEKVRLIEKPLQAVDILIFDELQAGDFLFIDSTHVSKTGSDVNLLFFDVLPRLNSGVFIHVHDIFYPFEYPKDWVLKLKYNWNEAYILRSFLSFNSSFEIVLFNTFLEQFHSQWFKQDMPLCLEDRGGSIWIRKK